MTDETNFLEATSFIDCGDETIKAFAQKAVGSAQTAKDKAIALYNAARELDPI